MNAAAKSDVCEASANKSRGRTPESGRDKTNEQALLAQTYMQHSLCFFPTQRGAKMTALGQIRTAANCDSLHYIEAGSFCTPAAGQRSPSLSESRSNSSKTAFHCVICISTRENPADKLCFAHSPFGVLQETLCFSFVFSCVKCAVDEWHRQNISKRHPTCAETDKSLGKFEGGGL